VLPHLDKLGGNADVRGMDFSELAAAVFLGNVLAVALVASVIRTWKQDYKEASWLSLAGMAMPILFFLSQVLTVEALPPFLAALASQ